jgi:hypothetical protein
MTEKIMIKLELEFNSQTADLELEHNDINLEHIFTRCWLRIE